MGIISKIRQEELEYIRLEHFLFVLNSSIDGSGFGGFYLLPKLLDKGLRLSYTESGYVFDEQMVFKGEVKCALKRLEKKFSDTDEPEHKLYKDEILKTQDGFEVSLGDLLVKRADVEKVYSEYGEKRFPWALVLWPQSSEDWAWVTVDKKFGAMSDISINNSALDVAEDCIESNDNNTDAVSNDRQRAVEEIRASRTLARKTIGGINKPMSARELLNNPIADLLVRQKPKDDKERHFLLHTWLNPLRDARAIQNSIWNKLCEAENKKEIGITFSDRQQYEEALYLISCKEDEIHLLLSNSPPIENITIETQKCVTEAVGNHIISNGPKPTTPLIGSSYLHTPSADYGKWLKADLWTIERAILLLINAENLPRQSDIYDCGSSNTHDEQVIYRKFMDIWDIAEGSLKAGGLKKVGSGVAGLWNEVLPSDFILWATSKGFQIPVELKAISTEKAEDLDIDGASSQASKNQQNVDSWLIGRLTPKPWQMADPSDPEPVQQWYVSARYFARKLVEDDPNLLRKRDLLAAKIVKSLDDVGIKKRGGKKSFDPSTIKKALININLG